MNSFFKKPSYRYLFALLITLVAASIQYFVVVGARVQSPGLLYPSTFLVAWFFGFGPACLSVAVAVAASNLLFYEPYFTFKLLEYRDVVRTVIFACTSVFAAWVVARGKNARVEQSKTMLALQSLQDRFTRSAAATNLGIWYCDLPINRLTWSSEAKEHFWLPPEEKMTLDIFYERLHPEDRERTRQAVADTVERGLPYDILYRTVHPTDPQRIKYIRAIGWTDRDSHGKAVRFDGISIDNSQMRLVSSERDESLEVLETINRVGKFLSAELDQKKLVQQVTDAATQLSRADFGAFFYNLTNELGESYTLYTISGVPREAFASFPMPRNTQVFAPTFAGREIVRSADITLNPRYGKNSPFFGMPEGHLPVKSYMAVPVSTRSGEVIGGLFFGHARAGIFTEREERIVAGLAAQVAIAMDNARLFEKFNRAIRVRDEFLSVSSHELRTPLTPLKMQLQTMSRYLDRGTLSVEQMKKMLSVSEKQVNRLTALVEDLLDVSRISAGKLNLNREDVDAVELVREVVERYQPQLQAVGCAVHLHLPATLHAKLDRLRFEQVLINLLTNAMKYAAGRPVQVHLSLEAAVLVLRVVDQGVGISKADQAKIFERFERVRSTENYGGLGLGLFIVQQIVSAHGGSVSVESEAEKGATFTVKIPL